MAVEVCDAGWDLALEHHQAGRFDAAETFYRLVLVETPNNPEALNLLAVILHERGDAAQSIALLQQAIAADPTFPDALVNLARALTVIGQATDAAGAAKRAIELDQGMMEAHLQLGLALLVLRDFAAATAAFTAAMALAPESLECHINLAIAFSGQREFRQAAAVLQRALHLEPTRPETLTSLGSVHSELGDHDAAIKYCRDAVALAPLDLRAQMGLATAFNRAKKAAATVDVCRTALTLAPNRAEIWTMLGSNLASVGQFDEAANCHRRALELDPDAHESRRELLLFRRDNLKSNEAARLVDVLTNETALMTARITAGFALGEQFDVQGEFDEAFASFAEANRLTRLNAEAGFDPHEFNASIDEQIANFPASLFQLASAVGNPSDMPVFIVGMPRSGTTLVEQIAASHSAIHGAGELQDVQQIVERLNSGSATDGKAVWRQSVIRAEADAHVARLHDLGGTAIRVIDKMPDNILKLGQIAVLFPNARVIVCRRDLRDVGLSCFFKQFTNGLAWTNSLADIATRAAGTERMMAHWRSVLPLQLLEISYETLVSNLEVESRRLIDFLGVGWEPSCLEFYKTQREVFTASRWQVRQPLYTSSLGRWRNYRKHLGPLLSGLKGIVPED